MKRFFFAAGWLVIAALLGITVFSKTTRIDLDIILGAAENLWAGLPVYDLTDTLEHTKAPMLTQFFIPLSKLGTWWASRLWDLLTVTAYPALVWFLLGQMGLSARGNRPLLFLLTLLLTLNPWNTEVWTGQMNVLLLVALLVSVSKVPAPVAGFTLMFTLGMKPPYLLFLPWLLRQSPAPKRLLVWTGIATGATALMYGAIFGWPALVADHLTWLRFLPESSHKHLTQGLNFGLPSVTREWPGASVIWLVTGAVASELACRSFRDKYVSLSIVAPLVVICSPMAWFQNYTLCAGLVALVLSDIFNERAIVARLWLGVAVAALIVSFPMLNPEIMRHTSWGAPFYTWNRIPLWGILVTLFVWSTYKFRRAAPSGDYVYPASRGGSQHFPV